MKLAVVNRVNKTISGSADRPTKPGPLMILSRLIETLTRTSPANAAAAPACATK